VYGEPVQDNLLSRSCCSWSYLARFNAEQSQFSPRNLRDGETVRRRVISQARKPTKTFVCGAKTNLALAATLVGMESYELLGLPFLGQPRHPKGKRANR
jgi:hypothetical protein